MAQFQKYMEQNVIGSKEKMRMLMDACKNRRPEPSLRRNIEACPNAGTVYQEAVRYLETSLTYDRIPAKRLWARIREGRQIHD